MKIISDSIATCECLYENKYESKEQWYSGKMIKEIKPISSRFIAYNHAIKNRFPRVCYFEWSTSLFLKSENFSINLCSFFINLFLKITPSSIRFSIHFEIHSISILKKRKKNICLPIHTFNCYSIIIVFERSSLHVSIYLRRPHSFESILLHVSCACICILLFVNEFQWKANKYNTINQSIVIFSHHFKFKRNVLLLPIRKQVKK